MVLRLAGPILAALALGLVVLGLVLVVPVALKAGPVAALVLVLVLAPVAPEERALLAWAAVAHRFQVRRVAEP